MVRVARSSKRMSMSRIRLRKNRNLLPCESLVTNPHLPDTMSRVRMMRLLTAVVSMAEALEINNVVCPTEVMIAPDSNF